MSVLESSMTDRDAAAMARTGEGDWEAFGLLVDRHRERLVRYLGRLVGDREHGEELAQEAFVRLWLAASRYREDGRFEAYLYSIATRLARSSERRRRVRVRALQAGQLLRFGWIRSDPGGSGNVPDAALGAADRLLHQEEQEQLALAVAALPVAFRAPLILAAVEERPVAEIARLLGLRPATVKTRLFRARRRLRELLEPYCHGGRP